MIAITITITITIMTACSGPFRLSPANRFAL